MSAQVIPFETDRETILVPMSAILLARQGYGWRNLVVQFGYSEAVARAAVFGKRGRS